MTSGANSLGSTPRIDGSSLRETGHRQFLALLTLLTHQRQSIRSIAAVQDSRSGQSRVLHRGLLVIVGAERGNPTETPPLRPRWSSTGRLSVDLNANPMVDLLIHLSLLASAEDLADPASRS